MVWWKDEVFCDKQTNQQTERLARNTEKEIKKVAKFTHWLQCMVSTFGPPTPPEASADF